MEKNTRLFLELGQLRGIETPQNTSVEDHYKLQYLRLPAPTEKPSVGQIKDLCRLATESQCFYRSNSLKQWLRTVVTEDQETSVKFLIHSNVVPRGAYLDAARCLDPTYCRGFFPATEISDDPGISHLRSCESCALAEKMREEVDHEAADQSNPSLLQVEDGEDVQDLYQSMVHKISWRSGTFIRKRFNSKDLFLRELQVVTAVSHPNIVHCFGYCVRPGLDASEDKPSSFHLFMECLDMDLLRFLNEAGEGSGSPFSFRGSLDVLLQVAEATKHLHEKSFVHGDLKPQNIFLSSLELAHSGPGVQYHLVKVGDFGSAQRVDSSGATVEPFEPRIGNADYTAPEVFRCRPRYGSAPPPTHPLKIDVYSFGVVAYQVLTGVVKLYLDSGSHIPGRVVDGLRPNSSFEGTLDDEQSSLLTYVERCWADNPEERPSFSEICDELNRRSSEYELRENAKRKHCESIAEGTNFVRSMKAAWTGSWKQALFDRNGMA